MAVNNDEEDVVLVAHHIEPDTASDNDWSICMNTLLGSVDVNYRLVAAWHGFTA